MTKVGTEMLENGIMISYCAYRFLIALYRTVENAKVTVIHEAYEWIEIHHWPEIEATLAIMAIVGLVSSRRHVFCFTALYLVLRAAIAISAMSVDLFTLSSGKSAACIKTRYYLANDLHYYCKWSDVFVLIYDVFALAALIMMCAISFIRLLYFPMRKNALTNHITDYYSIKQKDPKQPFKLLIFKNCDKLEQKQDCSDEPYKTTVI